MVFTIFLLLSIIFLVEYLNPLPKASGLLKNNFAAGIAVHNGMGLISRAAAAIMMPILGFTADVGNLQKITKFDLIVYFSFFPIMFTISYFARYYINEYVNISVDSVIRAGKIKFLILIKLIKEHIQQKRLNIFVKLILLFN